MTKHPCGDPAALVAGRLWVSTGCPQRQHEANSALSFDGLT
ncbi:hypothetical protein [Stutzerimonas stutzeri]|nr:hypothetical protein [Stutzerimonas stutzeri]